MANKRPTKKEQITAIIEHAKKNNLFINPGSGYSYALDAIRKFYHCPCDKNRPDCPCPESIEEVKTAGHCKCHLFWRDYQTFMDQMIQ